VLTELFEHDLSVPQITYDSTSETATIIGPTQIDVQADFYGDSAGDYCKAVKQSIRTGWGFDQFPAGIKPLYTDTGHQAPLTTGEQQYLRRWTLTISMQYDPQLIVSQQFFDVAVPNELIPVDVIYH